MANDASPTSPPNLAEMAQLLVASGQYRVQRRLEARIPIPPPAGVALKTAIFLDVETTGLDPSKDEVIELAMVPFTYGPDGILYEVKEAFQAFHQPSAPISAEITKLTGITDHMVAGHVIDAELVKAFVEDAHLVIAHNAGFDRLFAERITDTFKVKPWACSMSQVDWIAEGHQGTRLPYLVANAGFFYDSHRATNDCLAAIELLATPLPLSGAPAMSQLLERARRPSWRIWAENSPFHLKDILKGRGYRWNGDGTPFPKAWYIDVDDDTREAEIAFLQTEIYQRDVELTSHRIDAYNRFSDRL